MHTHTHTQGTFSAALQVFDDFLHLPLWNYKTSGDCPQCLPGPISFENAWVLDIGLVSPLADSKATYHKMCIYIK